MEIIEDKIDRELFFTSTTVNIGNGRATPFWEACWCNGMAPKMIAPNLFKAARYKKRMVAQELRNHNWIRNFRSLDDVTLITEFLKLADIISQTHLSEQEDTIKWRWSASGEYSARSAYSIQFAPTIKQDWAAKVWSAYSFHKCKFFAWTAILERINTDDVLMVKHWHHNDSCSLCFIHPESANHLLQTCSYTQAAWIAITSTLEIPTIAGTINTRGLKEWIKEVAVKAPKDKRRHLCGVLIFFWWRIWKERNARIFQMISQSTSQVVSSICQDISLYRVAMAHV